MERLPNNLPYSVTPNGGRLAMRMLDVVLNDILLLVPGFITVIVTSQLLGWGPTSLLMLVLGLLMFRFPYGRGYSMLSDYAKTLHIQYILKGVLWDPDPNARLVKRRLKQRQLFHLSVQVIEAGKQRVSVLHDEKKRIDHLYIIGRSSNAAALDMDGYEQFNLQVAEVIKHAKAETPLQIGASYGRLVRPYNPWKLVKSLEMIMDGDVAIPEGLVTSWEDLTPRQRVEMKLHQNGEQLKDLYSRKGADSIRMVVISIKRPNAWRKLKKRGLTERELYKAPVVRIANTIVTDLERIGVEGVRCLSFTELATLFRLSHDTTNLDAYRKALAMGRIPADDSQLEVAPNGEVLSDTQHLPNGQISVGDDWVDVAGTKHRTLRVRLLPRQVLPNVLHSLYGVTSHWSGMAFAGETISGWAESRRFTYGITLARSVERARGRKVYESHDEKLRKSELEKRHTAIQRSGSVGQNGNIFITISGANIEELEDAQHAFETVARAKGLVLKVVKGRSRQLRAMQTATLAINLM